MSDEPKVITDAQIEALIARIGGGDHKVTIQHLMAENKDYRDQRRDLKKTIKELEEKIPGEDTVILTKDQAKLWESYQELGKPEELKENASKVVELQGELDKRDQNDLLGKAATAVGFKPSVLIDLAQSKGLAIEMREIEVDGEKTQAPFARYGKDENGEMKPLTDFIDSQLADYKPALVSKEDTNRPPTVDFPTMRPGGQPPKTGATAAVADRILKSYPTPSEMKQAAKGD